MKFFAERIHRFLRLPSWERGVFTQAWAFFLLVGLALRVLPFKHVVALGRRLSRPTPGSVPAALPSLPRVIGLVEVAGRYTPGGSSCLERALVLSWVLRRRGVATTVRIGVARAGEGLEAHAWLEGDGRVILPPADPDRYQPLLPRG